MLAAVVIAAAGCHAATPTATQLLAQTVEQIKEISFAAGHIPGFHARRQRARLNNA